MNLAISSLIIFIIVSPAILARRIYFTKELSKSFVSRNTLQVQNLNFCMTIMDELLMN